MKPASRSVRFSVALVTLVALVGLVAVGVGAGASAAGSGFDSGASDSSAAQLGPAAQAQDAQGNVSEEAFVEPAPEEGDPYFEAVADDGRWISYINPRDEYRSPYLGDGSGKICVTLLNENGEVVAGESVSGTTVTVPTGDSVSWHSEADPFTVEYPLTEHYDRPLDADQFGTDPKVPQGDGYMDAHCMEIHGLPEDGGTVEYGEAQITGEHADRIELVGYVQQANDTWNTDVDPITAAQPYEEAGGGWTYYPGGSHGQVVVVLQLDGPVDHDVTDDGGNATDSDGEADASATAAADDDGDSDDNDSASGDGDEDGTVDGETESDDVQDGLPGFGVLGAVGALLGLVCARYVRG